MEKFSFRPYNSNNVFVHAECPCVVSLFSNKKTQSKLGRVFVMCM